MPNTPNFNWVLPTVGDDSGAWGAKLNTALNAADVTVKTVKTTADAALPKAGGVMSGAISGKTMTLVSKPLPGASGAVTLDLTEAQHYRITCTGAITIAFANVPAGAVLTGVVIRFLNGFAGVTWPSSVKWGLSSGQGAPPLSPGTYSDVVLLMTDDGGTTWQGVLVEQAIP